ncbi:amidohydrolase family protein [Snuella sedimenti]|uniref:Amidohydrolase family protein n=1 Tax=Snuella sedimenti TaxID=2798802 RepID=A0A8J7J213_9FLAO|nr:amidohydrolase family protein [Snuella sedimenti]MBJ6367634.1 amidohydrolase family protein [Snuella sedimenti]
MAKTYLPEPLYRLLSLRFVIKFLRWYYDNVKPIFYKNDYKQWKRFWYKCEMFFKRRYLLAILKFIIEVYLIIAICFYIGIWLFNTEKPSLYHGFKATIVKALIFIKESGCILVVESLYYKIIFFVLILVFFKSVRNAFFAILRQFKVLPGKEFTHLFERYVQIGLFSKYREQRGIYDKLKKQYPIDSHFVGLPMDMEFMKAGKIKKVYDLDSKKMMSVPKDKRTNKRDSLFAMKHQMEGLLKIKKRTEDKDRFHPFVFADPRRMADPRYFDYTVDANGDVKLVKGCLMQTYLEVHKFSGIKMYPALGYYPFDEALLPLWKYCIQKGLPVMTHCIKGTIFYRGKKKKEWDTHPIFTEGKVDKTKRAAVEVDKRIDFDINAHYIQEEDKPLYLNEVKNISFSNNFTNPLNYLCLLEEDLLVKIVDNAKDLRLRHIFYDANGAFRGGLKDLKICFAHFGGEDQWNRFLESDRDNYTTQMILQPEKGIDFFNNANGKPSLGKLAFIWKYVDWYTIICSIMLQYDNVYADISYILHNKAILALLKHTLTNKTLKEKILYGSDFYVVRNHKSDKAILADMRAGLTEEEFDQIARYNPRKYLNLGDFVPN